MTVLESLISGIVQGLTEFLPVSSSGHLVLVHSLFGARECRIFFDVCLHFATLGAVIVFFRKDIVFLCTEQGYKGIKLISVAIVPAVVAGVLFRGRLTGLFRAPGTVGIMLLCTGFIVLAGQIFLMRSAGKGKEPDLTSAVFIGIAQIFALIPGISRSGTTISAGLCSGVKGKDSFKFSFLLSIPLIAGAMLYETLTGELESLKGPDILIYAAGMSAAFVSGLFGLRVLSVVIKKARLWMFSVYCFIVGTAALVYFGY